MITLHATHINCGLVKLQSNFKHALVISLHIHNGCNYILVSPDRHVDNFVVRLIRNLNSGQIIHAYGCHISFTLAIMNFWQFRCSPPVGIINDKNLAQGGVDVTPHPAPWFKHQVSMVKIEI